MIIFKAISSLAILGQTRRLASVLGALIMGLALHSGSIKAQESQDASQNVALLVTCVDVNEPETCSFSEGAAISQGLVDLTEDLFNAIDEQQSEGICTRDGDKAFCSIGQAGGPALDLECDISGSFDNSASSASCYLVGLPAEAFSVNCSQDEQNRGECALQSNASALTAALEMQGQLNPQLKNVGVNLLTGCALRGGVESFQRDCDATLAALARGDLEAVQGTLDAVTALNVDNTMDSSRYALNTQLSHTEQRMSRVRGGARGIDIAGLQFFDGQQWVRAGDTLASNGNGTMNDSSPSSAMDSGRLGFFVDGAIITSEQDATAQESGSESDSQVLTLGVDYLISNNLIGGLAFSTGFSGTDYGRNRGSLDTTSFLLMGYGSYFRDGWHVDATVGIGGDSYDQERVLDCSSGCAQTFVQKAESDFYGNQTAITLGGGYDWDIGGFSISPSVQLDSVTLEVEGYRETIKGTGAGSGFALDIDDQDRDLLTLTVGSQFAYVVNANWGVFVPHLTLEYINELDDDSSVVNGRFVGNLGTKNQFTLATTEMDTTYFTVGLGASFQFSEGNAAFFDVKTWQGNDETDLIQYTAGWRWEL